MYRSCSIKWDKVVEKSFLYTPTTKPNNNVHLYGYYQSSLYFEEYKEYIVNLFKNKELFKKAKDCFNDLIKGETKEIVSIHVRRGDYVNSKSHIVQPLDYYKKAMDFFPNCTFVVFTNDKKWVLENFYKNIIISDFDEITELYMMSLCDHNIIANSSFSWWGAYLNDKPEKKVIAPKQWFGSKGPKEWDTIYDKDWIVI